MTTNHGDFSPEARTAADAKAKAADVFGDHAEHIVADLPELPENHVLVAIVNDGYEYVGNRLVHHDELVARVPEIEGTGKWVMVFSEGADADEVRRRASEMGTLARRRVEMIDRITARRNG